METVKKMQKMQGIFWSRDVKTLDIERDKEYIINQVLMYGSMQDIAWLKKQYPLGILKKIFLGHPQKIYTPQAFNFVVKIILNISNNIKIDEQKYLKFSQRNIG